MGGETVFPLVEVDTREVAVPLTAEDVESWDGLLKNAELKQAWPWQSDGREGRSCAAWQLPGVGLVQRLCRRLLGDAICGLQWAGPDRLCERLLSATQLECDARS